MISPLLEMGLKELSGRLAKVENLEDPSVMTNALASSADTDLQRLKESYSLFLAADTLWKGQLTELYKEELLTHLCMLKAAEYLLSMDMEDIADQLQGGSEALSGWLRGKTELTRGGEVELVGRYGLQLVDKMKEK